MVNTTGQYESLYLKRFDFQIRTHNLIPRRVGTMFYFLEIKGWQKN